MVILNEAVITCFDAFTHTWLRRTEEKDGNNNLKLIIELGVPENKANLSIGCQVKRVHVTAVRGSPDKGRICTFHISRRGVEHAVVHSL
jgi:hypothetical protein